MRNIILKGDSLKILKKYVGIVLATVMMFTAPSSALADTTAVQTGKVVNSVVNSLQVNYKLDCDTVIEITSFTDVDNEYVEIWRSVEKDGSGRLIYTKADESLTSVLSNQDYDLFASLVNAPITSQTRGADIGSDISGSQYKHISISSNTATLNNSALSQIVKGGIGTGASIIIGLINVPAGIAASIASFLYSSILALSPSKVTIAQSVYEVLFTYDNVYYTHCYHEMIKSYDSGGHLVDTTKMYKQAIGG